MSGKGAAVAINAGYSSSADGGILSIQSGATAVGTSGAGSLRRSSVFLERF